MQIFPFERGAELAASGNDRWKTAKSATDKSLNPKRYTIAMPHAAPQLLPACGRLTKIGEFAAPGVTLGGGVALEHSPVTWGQYCTA